jgi:hypothetical protein
LIAFIINAHRQMGIEMQSVIQCRLRTL